jgi:pSer/pThr/pTyr-binding forkhead associated (FHA) protein
VSELVLTLLRWGILIALWLFVMFTLGALRRDLEAPPEGASALPRPQPQPQARPKRTPRTSRKRASNLVVTSGHLSGTVIPLGSAPITIGRAPDSTLVVDDEYASARHARLFPHEGQWVAEDLGSTNGTWIGKSRLTAPTVLQVGQSLRVGQTVLELRK